MGAPSSSQEADDRAAEQTRTPRATELLNKVQAALDALPPRSFHEPEATFRRRTKLERLILHVGWYPDNGVEVDDQLYEAVIAVVEAQA